MSERKGEVNSQADDVANRGLGQKEVKEKWLEIGTALKQNQATSMVSR